MMRSFGMRRRVLTPEEAAANAAARERRDNLAKTCQICGNAILANKGVIAHHGYRRPYMQGYQTSSCMGARELPYENDRQLLGAHIKNLEGWLANLITGLEDVQAERIPVSLEYTPKDQHLVARRLRMPATLRFTRETLEAAKLSTPEAFQYGRIREGFDFFLHHDVTNREHMKTMVESDLKRARKRFEEWRRTHVWYVEPSQVAGALSTRAYWKAVKK